MDINEIIPYARNARHNKKAIPAVADSIRQFGLRGQIVLESRENPVIVTGHTRVEACKSLGWKEIPDENIAYCDGLTEDEIKAYRIADTFSEIAKKEINSIAMKKYSSKGVAMSTYGQYNSYEFFAEAFANAHLGAPNAIGLAMRDYLRDNKLK